MNEAIFKISIQALITIGLSVAIWKTLKRLPKIFTIIILLVILAELLGLIAIGIWAPEYMIRLAEMLGVDISE